MRWARVGVWPVSGRRPLRAQHLVDTYPDAELVGALVAALGTEFRYVDVWLDHAPPRQARHTFVISASNAHRLPAHLHAERAFRRVWHRITEQVTGPEALVLRDDYAPVERLVSDLLTGGHGR